MSGHELVTANIENGKIVLSINTKTIDVELRMNFHDTINLITLLTAYAKMLKEQTI